MNPNDTDFIDVEAHGFHVLMRPFYTLPYSKTLPVMEAVAGNEEHTVIFRKMIELFFEYLPNSRIAEFEEYSMEQATDIIGDWMMKR